MKKIIFAITIIVCMAGRLLAADEMKAVLSNPDHKITEAFFGLELNTRLDMIDYFEAGSSSFSNDDLFNSHVRVSALDDRHVRFDTDTPLSIDSYLLTPGNDSILVSVVSLPIAAGDVSVYVINLKTGRSLDLISPDYSDWLVKNAEKSTSTAALLATIPYVTASATVDPIANSITFTNTATTVPGIDLAATKWFRPAITYKWNGKKFVLKN